MATDTARVELELASGRNDITAPFHQTAQRRRKQLEPDAASVDAPEEPPAPTQVIVAVPLATAAQLPEVPALARTVPANPPAGTARPPWIAFIGALIVVGVGVWWVMSQRMPDIDPRVVIERNLNDARTAMADGRYTDPPERSAFHYFSTVLALDPDNGDAIAGIDAIADRHLTNARVLLAARKIAEAGVALEKARRVRPDHAGLTVLDRQWRRELRKILAASTVVAKPVSEPAPKTTVARLQDVIQRAIGTDAPAAKVEDSPSPRVAAGSAPDVEQESVAPTPPVADVMAAAPALAATKPSALTNAWAALSAPEPESTSIRGSGAGANIVDEKAVAAASPAPASLGSAEPKLIKMVQPEYPQEALMRGLEGWVDVSLQVSPSGDVIGSRVEDSSRGRMFNRAALAAVQQWKYEPRNDGILSERVRVRLQFKQSK